MLKFVIFAASFKTPGLVCPNQGFWTWDVQICWVDGKRIERGESNDGPKRCRYETWRTLRMDPNKKLIRDCLEIKRSTRNDCPRERSLSPPRFFVWLRHLFEEVWSPDMPDQISPGQLTWYLSGRIPYPNRLNIALNSRHAIEHSLLTLGVQHSTDCIIYIYASGLVEKYAISSWSRKMSDENTWPKHTSELPIHGQTKGYGYEFPYFDLNAAILCYFHLGPFGFHYTQNS